MNFRKSWKRLHARPSSNREVVDLSVLTRFPTPGIMPRSSHSNNKPLTILQDISSNNSNRPPTSSSTSSSIR